MSFSRLGVICVPFLVALSCQAPEEAPADVTSVAATLLSAFPGEAPDVLGTRPDAGIRSLVRDGTGLKAETPAALSGRLPFRGEEAIRFWTGEPAFEATVSESGMTGDAQFRDRAVAYSRPGATSFWTATADGFEEWILIESARDGETVEWGIRGATTRQAGHDVDLVDGQGRSRIRVSAPKAVAAAGGEVRVSLAADGRRIVMRLAVSPEAVGKPILVDPRWTLLSAKAAYNRYGAATVVLPDGRLMVIGGGGTTASQKSVEIYDPSTGTFSSGGTLNAARSWHAAALTTGGKVLVAGGYLSGSSGVSTAETWDPGTNAWTSTTSMSSPRYYPSAVTMASGKVLITGGYSGGTYNTAEIFNNGSWTTLTMPAGRYLHSTTLLANGKVLIAGGHNGSTAQSTCYLYDEIANTFTVTTNSLSAGRWNHAATLLSDGRVLVTGGTNGASLKLAEIYSPSAGMWSSVAGLMDVARNLPAVTELPGSKVLVSGGSTNGANDAPVASAEILDLSTGMFKMSKCEMVVPRSQHWAMSVGGGKVVIGGGYVNLPTLPEADLSVERYEGETCGCGNGVLNWDEQCDDGNQTGGDGCSASCTVEAGFECWGEKSVCGKCGDGSVGASEECDDGNTTGGDWCSSVCLKEATVPKCQAPSNAPESRMTLTGGYLSGAREGAATLVKDGKLWVIGGGATAALQKSVDVYDPVAGTWSTMAAKLNVSRSWHTAELLKDGKVMVIEIGRASCRERV